MDKIQNLYEKINPREEPEAMAERIIALSGEKRAGKGRRPLKFAAAFAVAVVVLTAGAVTAGAVGGMDIFKAFGSYFGTSELNAAGMLEYDKTIEMDGLSVKIKGFAADDHDVCVFFDVTFNDERFFENGELKENFLNNNSPVFFNAYPQFLTEKSVGNSYGAEKTIAVNGNTVSYVGTAQCSSAFNETPLSHRYAVMVECSLISSYESGYNGESEIRGEKNSEELLYVNIPVSKKKVIEANEEVTMPDGGSAVIKRVVLNSISLAVYTDEPGYIDTSEIGKIPDPLDFSQKMIMKDGSVIELNGERSMRGSSTSWDLGEETRMYSMVYGGVIDPDEIAAFEILGKRFE